MAAELLFVNPVTQIIQDARYALINQNESTIRMTDLIHDWRVIIPGLVITLTVLVGAWKSKYFAEDI